MGQFLEVKVLSPLALVKSVTAREVNVRTQQGYIGILPNHVAYAGLLGVGEMSIDEEGGAKTRLLVSGGYVEVAGNCVTVLGNVVEAKGSIDVVRAEKARQRAVERLGSRAPDVDIARSLESLERAEARLAFAKKP